MCKTRQAIIPVGMTKLGGLLRSCNMININSACMVQAGSHFEIVVFCRSMSHCLRSPVPLVHLICLSPREHLSSPLSLPPPLSGHMVPQSRVISLKTCPRPVLPIPLALRDLWSTPQKQQPPCLALWSEPPLLYMWSTPHQQLPHCP